MSGVRTIALKRLELNTLNLQATAAFYVEALGFRPAPGSREDTAVLRLGAQTITLLRTRGAPYPEPPAANAPWFQHFAIAVSDMRAAYARLALHPHAPISRGGPQRLPPRTGSVIAYKFRDPDGHPLELLQPPGGVWAHRGGPGPTLGIDHTAIAVSDLARSLAFYEALGFAKAAQGLNSGAEQDRLDGLSGVQVDIVSLVPAHPGPNVELLHYRTPGAPAARRVRPKDVASTAMILKVRADPQLQPATRLPKADPDGHRLVFTP